jgi:hypothetical protein
MHVHLSLTVYESLIFAAIMQGMESTEEMVNPWNKKNTCPIHSMVVSRSFDVVRFDVIIF